MGTPSGSAPRCLEAQTLHKRVIIVMVGEELPGHPAEGKLVPGDRILDVDGEHVETFAELHRIINGSPNKELKLTVFRNNEHIEVAVIPEERILRKPLDIIDKVGEIGIKPNQPAVVVGIPGPIRLRTAPVCAGSSL